jgi:undecaprenyl pyrophosphate phosphatase UppP
MVTRERTRALRRYWPRLLLIIPFAFVVGVPFYNRIEPTLFGIPFFYWYQLLAIILGALVVMGVYVLDRRETTAAERAAEKALPGDDSGQRGRP